jgi:hypothetical protein
MQIYNSGKVPFFMISAMQQNWDPDFAVEPGSVIMISTTAPISFFSIGSILTPSSICDDF